MGRKNKRQSQATRTGKFLSEMTFPKRRQGRDLLISSRIPVLSSEVKPPVSGLSSSQPKKKILFIGESSSLAHIGRPAILARWAKEAGYDVSFACGEAYADIARAEGLEPIPLHTIAPKTFFERLAQGKFFYTAEEIESYVKAELALFARIQPDLVVGDFRLSLSISTTMVGIPFLSLINAHWSPSGKCKMPPPNIAPFKFMPKTLRNAFFSLIRPLAFRLFGRELNVVRKKFGLPTLSDLRKHYTAGRWCAYLDVPRFYPVANLPKGHFYLGSVEWQPDNLAQPRLGQLGAKRPLAYVTMGSSGDTRVLIRVLRSLMKLDCDVALSGISETHYAQLRRELPKLAERSFCAPLFDPREVLKRASFTVCHGGSGTVYQSLKAGVPVLCLPSIPDQGLVSNAAARNEAGLTLEFGETTEKRLTTAMAAFLSSGRYAEGARQMAQAINAQDPRQTWLKFLEQAVPVQIGVAVAVGRQ